MSSQEESSSNLHLTESEKPSIRRLSVKKMWKETEQQELEQFFSNIGPVEECVMKSRNGELKASVTFCSTKDAKRALEDGNNKKLVLRNRVLHVWAPINQPARSMEETQTVGTDGARKIAKIDNFDLLKTVEFLPIYDKMCLEIVSNRFRGIHQKLLKCDTKLILDNSMWEMLNSSDDDNPEILHNLLNRYGERLREIHLPYIDGKTHPDQLSDFARRCPNLQVIDITTNAVSSDSIILLSENCRNIVHLTLNVVTSPGDAALTEFFKQSTQLTYFKIGCNLGGECLKHLPPTIRVIELHFCDESEFNHLEKALENMQDLSVLKFGSHSSWTTSVLPAGLMEALTRHCTQLKEFHTLDYFTADPSCQILITKLANLEVLKLNIDVDDVFLQELSGQCRNLIELEIYGWSITLAGIEALAALPQLERLTIHRRQQHVSTETGWKGINPKEIQKLPRISDFRTLKYLQCNFGCTLNPSEMCCLIESSPQLELTELKGYEEPFAAEDIIDWLISETGARNSKVAFDLLQASFF